MRTTVTQSASEVVVEETAPASDAEPRGRGTTGTEADKIRRQLMLRRKTKLARHALLARRSR